MGKIMAPSSVLSGWFVQSAFRLLGAWPRVRDYFAQMKYKPPPRFNQGFLLPESLTGRRALVGRLLQQPTVTRVGGARALLDEVLGSGFAWLGHVADVAALRKLAAHSASQRLGMRTVGVASKAHEAYERENVEIVVDESGALLRSLSERRGDVLLIRPDHYVAATLPVSDVDYAARRLEELVASTWSPADQALLRPLTA
jgi:3-(3-hydroxy-phenyl)propionate hydroxylase